MTARGDPQSGGQDWPMQEGRPAGQAAIVPVVALKPDPRIPSRFLTADLVGAAVDEIDQTGLLRPLMVRPADIPDSYYVFVGVRMLAALKAHGVTEVPVKIFEVTPSTALWLASSEQEARAEWSPIRTARFVFRMITQPDGSVDEEALQRCRRLFGNGPNKALTRTRIRQMWKIGGIFTEEEAAARKLRPGTLASISGRELLRLSQRSDPWEALHAKLDSATEGDAAEVDKHVRVRNRRDGGRTVVLPGTPPETWSDEDVERFVATVGPIWTVISPDETDQEDAAPDSAEPSSDPESEPVSSDNREELLRHIACLATELAAANSVIAALHASRAVMERRRADAAESASAQAGRGKKKRWAQVVWAWMRNAFRPGAKRVSPDGR